MSMREFSIGAWTLCKRGTDEVPLIADDELARQMGYGRALEVRKKMDAGIRDGIFKRDEVIREPLQTTSRGGRPVSRYLFTEEQALWVIAKCETEIANQILKEVIHVFYLARRGMLPGQGNQQIDIQAIGTVIAKAVSEGVASSNTVILEGMNRMLASFDQTVQKIIDKNLQDHVDGTHMSKQNIGAGGSRHICDKIRQIAEVYWPDDAHAQKRVQSELHLNLRSEILYYGTRSNWCYMPQDKWQAAMKWLGQEYRAALKRVVATGGKPPKPKDAATQMSFHWGDPSDETEEKDANKK